jgi:hypothetical protein
MAILFKHASVAVAGKCVVAGNVRRTAEIAFGNPDDVEYIDLKGGSQPPNPQPHPPERWMAISRASAPVQQREARSTGAYSLTLTFPPPPSLRLLTSPPPYTPDYSINPHRVEYGWTSNNSVFASLGMDYRAICERVCKNGEPGFAWLDNMRVGGWVGGQLDEPCPGLAVTMRQEAPSARVAEPSGVFVWSASLGLTYMCVCVRACVRVCVSSRRLGGWGGRRTTGTTGRGAATPASSRPSSRTSCAAW